jgi:phosphoenolpyruvate carboxylase
MREEYEKNKEEIEKEYLTVLDDYSEEYRIKINSCTQEINRLSD